jgi:hypothetical protein
LILSLSVALAALTLRSFYADNHAEEAAARALACAGHAADCPARLARFERSPLRQTFVFRVGGADARITCRRAYLLVGDSTCQPDR